MRGGRSGTGETGLSVLQRAILKRLRDDAPDVERSASDLAMWSHKGHGAVLKSLSALHRRGLVKRRQHPAAVHDARPKYLWSAER